MGLKEKLVECERELMLLPTPPPAVGDGPSERVGHALSTIHTLETKLMESTSLSVQIGMKLDDCKDVVAEYENDETPTRRELASTKRRLVTATEIISEFLDGGAKEDSPEMWGRIFEFLKI